MTAKRGDSVTEMPSDLRPLELEEPPQPTEPQDRRKGITNLTVNISSSSSRTPNNARTHPSRWKTPEFIFYGVVFCTVVPLMVWVPVWLSNESHPNYPYYHRKLSPGWLLGRKVDNSDSQYRGFRSNFPLLTLLIMLFRALKSIYSWVLRRLSPAHKPDTPHLIPFYITFSLIMLFGLCGASTLKILVILSLNYYLAKFLKQTKISPLVTWIFNMAILFANEYYSGYRFGAIHPSLGYLDSIEGVYPRWHINFNITMLRLISFNLDYYWALRNEGTKETGFELRSKERTTTPHPLEFYNFKHYIAYALYSPLYIAGPIMTFNDFMWQLRRPTVITLRMTLGYLLRFAACMLTMEFILHFMYVVAIKDTKAWQGDSAAELSMIGFWNLIVVWLKLLLPWRFFRLWALLDGIDPPENMVRCMVNNYSTLGFWRSWHRSYNLWIVRYIYIPLGGTKNVVFTTVLIFSFVALWHDLSFKLLAWGWLVSLFILPELAASYFLPSSKFDDRPWYRHVCAIGAVFNILMMVVANLVGFVVGTDGISYLLEQLFLSWGGFGFMLFACVCIFIAIQVMFEYRETEMRRGIYRRC